VIRPLGVAVAASFWWCCSCWRVANGLFGWRRVLIATCGGGLRFNRGGCLVWEVVGRYGGWGWGGLVGCVGAFGATLTLPGIAGIVLTMGMAVDGERAYLRAPYRMKNTRKWPAASIACDRMPGSAAPWHHRRRRT